MPVELMLMLAWFPVRSWRFSYWSRTGGAAPGGRSQARPGPQPGRRRVPRAVRDAALSASANCTTIRTGKCAFFLKLDRLCRSKRMSFRACPPAAGPSRRPSVTPRLNGEDGLGAELPAMANSVMAFDLIGMDHADPRFAARSVRQLVVEALECVATGRATASHACRRCGYGARHPCRWRADSNPQIRASGPPATGWRSGATSRRKGDGQRAPRARAGRLGIPIPQRLDPDVDDTAVVGMLLHRVDSVRKYRPCRPVDRRGCRAPMADGERSTGTIPPIS